MRKPLKLAVHLFLLTLSLASHAVAETVLRVVTYDFPPLISRNEENRESYLIEILRAVGDEMGVTFAIDYMPWKRGEQTVMRGEAWGTLPYIRTPEREKHFLFSDELYHNKIRLFHYRARKEIRGIDFNEVRDLAGHSIGGVMGYFYVSEFLGAGGRLELVTNDHQNIQKLILGRVSLALINETVGWYIIEKDFPGAGLENFGTLEKPYSIIRPGLMTSKAYPGGGQILSRFNAALKKVKASGTYRAITDKYGVRVYF